jgi:hypothetical protein
MAEEAKVQETEASPEKFDADYVKELRQENAGWRTKLRDTESQVEALNAKLKKFEDANKSELERITEEKALLERERDELRNGMEKTAVDTAILIAANREKFIDPNDVAALIDRSEIAVMDGKVTGIDKAVKKLIKEKPHLVKGEEPPTPPPSPGVGGQPLDGSDDKGVDAMFLRALRSAQTR